MGVNKSQLGGSQQVRSWTMSPAGKLPGQLVGSRTMSQKGWGVGKRVCWAWLAMWSHVIRCEVAQQ